MSIEHSLNLRDMLSDLLYKSGLKIKLQLA